MCDISSNSVDLKKYSENKKTLNGKKHIYSYLLVLKNHPQNFQIGELVLLLDKK